ncbi:MAG: PaaI family thioesterase [Pseudomonadales bacterium]|nr:PaaI family thioesterase [Pseudomonadales bacterium]
MTQWQQALDIAVSGNIDASLLPPHIDFLHLPMLSHWHGRRVEINWQATEDIYQGSGMVFGGYLSALADYIAGAAMLTVLKDGQNFATRRLCVDFKRPVKAGEVKIIACIADEREDGADVEVEFIDSSGVICATALVNQVYIA